MLSPFNDGTARASSSERSARRPVTSLTFTVNGLQLTDHSPNASTYTVKYVYVYENPQTQGLTQYGIPPKVGTASVPMTNNGDGTITLNLGNLVAAMLEQEGLTPGTDHVWAEDGSLIG